MNKIDSMLLGDLIEFQRGYDLSKAEMIKGPYPVRSSNGLLGYHNEFKVNGPGITIGRSGTVGIPHLIKENFYAHNTTLFVKDFKGNNVEYIFYLLKNLNLGDRKSGTGVPTMNRNHLHPLSILAFKDIANQKMIAKVLSDLDAKIEVNNKINAELESIAKLIYDYWFVQFDFPDENGKPYKSSGGKMIYNEELKREIPEGWEVKNISEISIIKAGGDKPNEISNAKSDYFNIPIYSNGIQNDGLYGFTTLPKITNPSITVSARGTIGFTVLRLEPFVPIVRLICLTPKDKENLNFLYHRISMMNFTDTGSIQKQLTVPMINSLKIVIPKKELLVKFNKLTDVILNKIRLNKDENKMLTELRDWLLPMLMNGQLTVN